MCDGLERIRAVRKPETNDITVHSSSRKLIFAVPFEVDPHFISRKSISSAINDQLERRRRAVLCGMGGVG